MSAPPWLATACAKLVRGASGENQPPSVRRSLKRLEAEGYAVLRVAPGDGQLATWTLTPKGLAARERAT